MKAEIFFYIYLCVLPVSVIIGFIKYRKLHKPERIILLLLCFTVISEALTRIIDIHKKNVVYHFYDVCEIFLMTLFFLNTLNIVHKKVVLLFILLFWGTIELINTMLYQPIYQFNSNICMLEGITVIGMALYVMYKFLMNDSITIILKHSLFWLWTLFLIMWVCTLFFCPIIGILENEKSPYLNLMECIQAIINIIVYIGIGVVFWISDKLQPNEIK